MAKRLMPHKVWIAHRVDGTAWLAESFRTKREASYHGRIEQGDDGSRWTATAFVPLPAPSDASRQEKG